MKLLFQNYINTFKGLSTEVWWLALITLINRAGTMVIPFLSLYLTENLHFSLIQVGWIMSAFGAGSVVGSWLGGRLTDKIGYYKVMVISLITSGFLFIGLQFLNTFVSIAVGVFVLLIAADMFRPAMFVALSAYSKPENKVRSVTLIRLAINLGFSAGPAIGGLIIVTLSYGGLFWVDGITCFLASILLLNVLHPKKARIADEIVVEHPKSAYKDINYIIFLFAMLLFGVAFLQYFSTVPLFYKDIHHLSEFQIGLLMGLNGFIIFALEMPLVKYFEKSWYSKTGLVLLGAILLGLSFLVLNLSNWTGILVIGMIFMTVGEMIAFPFSNAFALERAKKGNQGEYMALYSISFSIAHIIAHNSGMHVIANYGYKVTWYTSVAIMLICISTLYYLKLRMIRQKDKQ
ncbi:MDR family MFS transporter [Formosa haliotis]|uniref:MDR family MFS transporter n=1 Tax=Formosa haliotis TaxID=1555194 RepID=UPI00082662D0|nr:MFS transporter [Formosa haliotis]